MASSRNARRRRRRARKGGQYFKQGRKVKACYHNYWPHSGRR